MAKIGIIRRIYSIILLIIGIAGVFLSLSSVIPMTPILGMLIFILSIGVVILGLDYGDEKSN
jgi:hypothetical protein